MEIANFLFEFGYLTWIALFILAFLFILKMNKIKELDDKTKKLESELQQLDEQAKLVIQTDLQLTKTQDALDREIGVLYALNELTHIIGSTLDENEIFKRIDSHILVKLGFEKILIWAVENNGEIKFRAGLGYFEEDISNLRKDVSFIYNTIKNTGSYVRVYNIDDASSELKSIMRNLSLDSLISVPIAAKEAPLGLIIAGNKSDRRALLSGDVEIISILANQISRSFENIKLYEQAWDARQSLELKIKERTKELTDALGQLEQISKTKSEFISAVSHELRTPLTSIKGYSSILSSGKLGTINENIKIRLDKINKHVDSLTKLVNELLDISRIESGKASLKYEEFKLSDVAANLQDIFHPQLKEKNINLVIDVPENLYLNADKNLIERLILNLISNALKFTPKQGKINLSAAGLGSQIVIKVADDGSGIDKNDLPHIFKEFYRANNEINEKVKGTGLGLSLCKSIIDAHKGSISCESELGKGSIFTVKLPK